ncbi:TonB-linked outer membrane protein, SusC/RagA family [Flavobacterium flevense]|uniref:SusC/RagA family TonB-linked outer membrane protein n=1 Tax=Flavobacterium flevense TaxID=983 RepID=A0A4Y4AW98_9FLAO|nr:TonB-dependent receptor [Flavobacterium flevense]GEC72511.1 SusC/RagA family TonB-linked outer membrane protein [Flavobacterium flevense]SHM13541.1 TonB-linked outer membrane protein, SusC/RagA family [Flavobacterium flevense]
MKFQLFKNLKTKAFVFTLISFLCFSVSHGQAKSVKGTVTSKGELLFGVNIIIKNTTKGTVTDIDGNFNINASPNDILIVSYLGYQTKEITVGDKSVLKVVLQEDTSKLEEVVVIGYGTVKRKDLTGSVVSLKADDLDKVQTVSFEGALAAKASGVQVVSSEGGPGAGFKIRVRGGSSINASNDPLYVIDGFAIDGTAQGTGLGIGNTSTSPLSAIDPSNIESIEVLKDASATAIYGSRGANGVIIITTKKGKKGRADFNFETYSGFSVISNKIDLLSAQEFVDWRNEYSPWDPNNASDEFVSSYRDQYGNDISLKDPRVVLTDWQDQILRTAYMKNYKLATSGGSDRSSYSASFSYLNQEGIIKTSDFERYNGNLSLDQTINDKLKTGMNIGLGYNKTGGVVSSATENANGRSGIVTNAVLFAPVQGLKRFSDAEYDEDGRLVSLRGGDISNPNYILENDINNGTAYNVYGNIYLEYKILRGLSFKSSLRMNTFGGKNKRYFSEKYGWGKSANGRAFLGTFQGQGITTEQNLNYNKKIGDHSLNITAVYEQQQTSFENVTSASTGFDLPNINLDNLGTATVTLPTQSNYSGNALKSYLSRIQYDYKDRYTLNVSARYDGSSRFAEGKKWGFFPSVGAAWKVNNEEFLKDVNWLSNLKLKASYGETGNTAIGSFRSLASAGLASTIFNGNAINTGVAIDRLSNKDLTWETTSQVDAGISLGLFNSRLNFEVDYYEKETTDLLLEVPLPSTSGYRTAFKNLGAISNKGLEISFHSINVQTDNFKWSSDFNISFNKNKVLDLGGAKEFFITSIGDNQIRTDYVVRVGESLGSIYGLKTAGVYNYSDFAAFDGLTNQEASAKIYADAATQGVAYTDVKYTLKAGVPVSSGQPNINNYRPGLPKFEDQLTVDTNGDGILDAGDGIINSNDRTIIGRAVPKHFGGMTNNFTYKNFDLSVLTSWSYGNDVYNKNIKQATAQDIPFFNKYGSVADRWTPNNPDTDIPGVKGESQAGVSGNAYSSYVEDGSYLRLANITFGYNLHKELVKKIGLKSFRIYGAIDNVFVWTKYSGYDPDVSVGNNQLTPGLDVDSYPKAKTFRIGLNVGF